MDGTLIRADLVGDAGVETGTGSGAILTMLLPTGFAGRARVATDNDNPFPPAIKLTLGPPEAHQKKSSHRHQRPPKHRVSQSLKANQGLVSPAWRREEIETSMSRI